ncbi:MAG: hypothetical protein H0X25_20955 [Acidobacteriales bacterium]|nr:hypothetical protein [Terriglobales bacterium]
MKSDYALISSVLLLAVGLGLICGFTQGSVGFDAAVPVSAAALKVSLTTTGLPAMIGVPLTLLGLLLLIAAAITAIVRQVPGTSGA